MKFGSITKYSHFVDTLLAIFIIYIFNLITCSNNQDLHEKICKTKKYSSKDILVPL